MGGVVAVGPWEGPGARIKYGTAACLQLDCFVMRSAMPLVVIILGLLFGKWYPERAPPS